MCKLGSYIGVLGLQSGCRFRRWDKPLAGVVAEHCWYICLSGKITTDLQLRAVGNRPYTLQYQQSVAFTSPCRLSLTL